MARLFKDGIHGSPEAVLEQAKAYREAVIAALPPRTNREQAVHLHRNNTSGVSGVSRAEPASGGVWRVTLTAKDGLRRAEFAVAEHGEDRAERLALAQRRAWLDALPPAFTTADPHADAVARRLFGAELTRAVDVHPNESLSPAELETQLAAVDARFDALRPPRLRVRVRSYVPGEFAVAVSDAGRPARRRLVQVRRRTMSLLQALRDVEATVDDLVTELYGPKVARWFAQDRLLGLLFSTDSTRRRASTSACWCRAQAEPDRDDCFSASRAGEQPFRCPPISADRSSSSGVDSETAAHPIRHGRAAPHPRWCKPTDAPTRDGSLAPSSIVCRRPCHSGRAGL